MATLFARLRAKLAFLIILWRRRLRIIRWGLTYRPIAGGAPDGDGDAAAAEAGDDTGSDDGDAEDADDGDEDAQDDDQAAEKRGEPNWKQLSRKHERSAKKALKEKENLEKALKARDDEQKSDHDKAVEDARKSAREELQGEHEKERRQDRLDVAVTKLAAKGLKVGEGDDAKTVKFADTDDALLHLERDVSRGDLEIDDLFDDKGRVRPEALEEALTDLLERKPHLAAATSTPKPSGSADGGKGKPAKTDTSVQDQLNKIRRHQPDSGGAVRVGAGRRA